MKELDFQRFICKTVLNQGGWAIKLSNRFLVGVPDLLIALPKMSAMLVEAKWDERCPSSRLYTLELTPKQAYTLRMARKGGMVAGAISLLTCGKSLGVRAVHIDCFFGDSKTRVNTLAHTWCDRPQLDSVVMACLRELYDNHEE